MVLDTQNHIDGIKNMRKIKFRAWDSKLLRFTYFHLFNVIGSISEEDKSTIQQFTGLLDRNGKEIYEGDLVSVLWNHDKFLISFKNGCFVMATVPLAYYCKECEVIGNMYETPITS